MTIVWEEKELDISQIRKALPEERYEISQHAEQERRNDGLSLADVENAIHTGEIIELYPNDPRGPSCLVYGLATNGRPVHVVAGFLTTGWVRVIMVYVPNPEQWEDDWKTRKRREE
ncbi:MAG: DUF4258 domain-containing protein [Bacillota bacterium]